MVTKEATISPTKTFSDTSIKINRLHDALRNAQNNFNKAPNASAQDTVSNTDNNSGGLILEVGEVGENNNNKESEKYAIARGTN